MKVVLDTNVLVSGIINPFGASAYIVSLATCGEFTVCFDARILAEYFEVLRRAKFNLKKAQIDPVIDQLKSSGEFTVAAPLKAELADRDDEMFLEVAISAKARYLITGNIKHYPKSKRQGMAVVSPNEFISIYKKDQ